MLHMALRTQNTQSVSGKLYACTIIKTFLNPTDFVADCLEKANRMTPRGVLFCGFTFFIVRAKMNES